MGKRLILHIGLPKCASTSLQRALMETNGLYFPQHGLHHFEHIAIPLKIKGLDDWTAQWFSAEWVDEQFDALVSDINSTDAQVVVISSERLADITPEQLNQLLKLFPSFEVELLLLYRPKDDFVKSMWRHAVFRHDLAEDFKAFSEGFVHFDPLGSLSVHRGTVPVHAMNIKEKGWESGLSDVLGLKLQLPVENVSAKFECCYYLQQIHKSVGSEKFKAYFNDQTKKEFCELFSGSEKRSIEDFIVPILRRNSTD